MKKHALFLTALFALSAAMVFWGVRIPIAHADPTIKGKPAAQIDQAGSVSSLPTSGTAANANLTTPNNVANPGKNEGYNGVIAFVMSIFAWLLGVSAVVLEYAVYYTVVKMGTYIHGISAIAVVWRVLRDIGNIFLIFGFVAMGIETIINTSYYGNVSKRLPTLLIVAVLLNFSLFFTEAIIDFGNLFAVQFYAQINGSNIPVPQNLLQSGTVANEGISNAIMSKLGMTTLYGDAQRNTVIFQGGWSAYIGLLGIILFIVAAFVMFYLAFILIARFVTLIFLIIVAPIGFAGYVVPKLEGIAAEWWSMLINQTLTAPILMLMLYVALKVILDPLFLTGFGAPASGGGLTGFVTGSAGGLAGFGSMILSFIVAMGLLLGVTVLAKMMSASGAGAATKLAGALSFGAVAYGMRNTVGAGATRAAAKFQNTRLARTPVVGRALSGAFSRGASASFDVRGIKGTKNIPFGGLNAGDAQKGGFKKVEEEAVKARVKYASTLRNTVEEQAELDTIGDEKKGGIKDLGESIKATKEAHATAQKQLESGHKTALAPLTNKTADVESRYRAAEIEYKANTTLSNKAKLDTARASVDEARTAQAAALEGQRKEAEELVKEQKEALKTEQEKLDKLKERKKELTNTPQSDYADGIVKWPGSLVGANKAARDKIIKEVSKSKEDKANETMLAALKKIGDGEGEKKKEEKKSE